MESISRKVREARGVFHGCDELALKKPPAVGAEHLGIAIWLRADLSDGLHVRGWWSRRRLCGRTGRGGSWGGRRAGCSSVVAGVYGRKFWITPCETSIQVDEHNGRSRLEVRRTRSHPEVCDHRRAVAHEAADHGRPRRPMPVAAREEIVQNQGYHLGEIGERRFAAIALAVGVGGETDGVLNERSGDVPAKAWGLRGR